MSSFWLHYDQPSFIVILFGILFKCHEMAIVYICKLSTNQVMLNKIKTNHFRLNLELRIWLMGVYLPSIYCLHYIDYAHYRKMITLHKQFDSFKILPWNDGFVMDCHSMLHELLKPMSHEIWPIRFTMNKYILSLLIFCPLHNQVD